MKIAMSLHAVTFGEVTLTTDHAASSYGIPVLLVGAGRDGPYGPGDLVSTAAGLRPASVLVAEAAAAAGFSGHSMVQAFLIGAVKAPPPATNEIRLYLHCMRCIGELDARARAMGWDSLAAYTKAVGEGATERDPTMAPMDYARLDVGWTPCGIQVWCRRHEANVLSIDFEGVRHPATTAAHAAPPKA